MKGTIDGQLSAGIRNEGRMVQTVGAVGTTELALSSFGAAAGIPLLFGVSAALDTTKVVEDSRKSDKALEKNCIEE
jgi:hypothetical protein